MRDIEQQIVFALGQREDGTPLLMVGVPKDAWDYIKDGGHEHVFSLRSVGMPLDFIMFGGKDHAACMKRIESVARSANVILRDERRRDFRMKDVNGEPIGNEK